MCASPGTALKPRNLRAFPATIQFARRTPKAVRRLRIHRPAVNETPAGRAATCALPQLGDLQFVEPGPVPDRLLAPRQRLGDRAQRLALAGEQVQLLDLVLPPRLPVPLELGFSHVPLRACSGRWRGLARRQKKSS